MDNYPVLPFCAGGERGQIRPAACGQIPGDPQRAAARGGTGGQGVTRDDGTSRAGIHTFRFSSHNSSLPQIH
jgi:hypothetical protein